MTNTKRIIPIFILTTGLMGVLFCPTIIIFDGGLHSAMNMPATEYKNSQGKSLYTLKELRPHMDDYVHTRATLWALDILAVYMLLMGVLFVSINYNALCESYQGKRKTKLFVLDIPISIFMGVVFWFIVANVLSRIHLPLH